MPTTWESEKKIEASAHVAGSLWRNRDYLLLVGGQVVSTLGSQFSLIAFTGTLTHLLFDGIVLLVIVLGQHMHAAPFAIGLVLAMDGVGGMIGSILADRFQRILTFRVAFIGGHWLWAVLWFLLLLPRDMIALSIVVALLYAVLMIADLAQFSYRRVLIPDEFQGRVNSVFRLISYSGAPFGLALAGFLLQAYGPTATILLLGCGVVVTATLIALNPHVRRARPLAELARASIDGGDEATL